MSVNKLPKNRLYSEILGNDTFKNFGMVAVAINNQQNQQLKMVPGAGLEPGVRDPLSTEDHFYAVLRYFWWT
jgi:hypothetical protein